MLSRQQNVLSAAREVGLHLFGQHGNRERVPAQRVGIAVARFQLTADGGNPDQMQAAGDKCHIPEGSVVERISLIRRSRAARKYRDRQVLSRFRTHGWRKNSQFFRDISIAELMRPVSK
ncbi:hypothetical protein D3C87_1516460 [compost metagenome]